MDTRRESRLTFFGPLCAEQAKEEEVKDQDRANELEREAHEARIKVA